MQKKKEFTVQLKERSEDEDKANFIVNYIQSIGEDSNKWVTLSCKKCCTSFYSDFQMMVLTKFDTMKWSLIWENIKTIKNEKTWSNWLERMCSTWMNTPNKLYVP